MTGDGDDLIVVVDPRSSPRLAFGCKQRLAITLTIICHSIILTFVILAQLAEAATS